MPGMDGTGPRGLGQLTGRGLGPCGAGLRRGFGRGLGRGRGYRRPLTPEEEKEALEGELEYLDGYKAEVEKRLKSLGSE